MSFFQSIKSKLANFSQDVANQSKMMTESAQIQEKITAEEKELNVKYQALGRAYYVRQQAARAAGEKLLMEDISAFEGIDASLSKINDLKKNLDRVQRGVD